MDMEKKRNKKKRFLKFWALLLVSILSCFCLSGCMGTSGSGGSGGSSSGSPGSSSSGNTSGDDKKDDKSTDFKNEYSGQAANVVDNYNDVFLGAIGVYEIDNSTKSFYDNYSKTYVNFNYLLDRQFETLATVIYHSLWKTYGPKTYSFDKSISGYGNGVSLAFDNVVTENDSVYKATLYYNTKTLYYYDAISGGHAVKEIEGSDGLYEYDENEIDKYNGGWANQNFTIPQMTNQLRYIYVNTKTSGLNDKLELVGDRSTNTVLNNLKNTYKSFTGTLGTNESISTIGFSKDYMWNVLYYVAYSIIGEKNINATLGNVDSVFNGNSLTPMDKNNREFYKAYKGYDKVLPNLISNCFKLVINSKKISVGGNYCFSISNYSDFYNVTLFPILNREEYIFFDDVDDICDAEEIADPTPPEKEIDYDNLDPKDIEDINPDEYPNVSDLENKTTQVGSLRKIKRIIMIPYVSNSKFQPFSINTLSLCFATKSGELEVEILTYMYDQNGKYSNSQLKFDDGSFSVKLPDGTTVDNNTTNPITNSTTKKDEMVTSSGHLIVQSTPSTYKYTNVATIFETESQSMDCQFSSISNADKNIIKNSFVNTSYTVSTTNEKINIGRLKVCNQLFAFSWSSSNTNGVDSSLFLKKRNKNYIEFAFNYYKKGGSALSYIPNLYLLDFSF